MLSLNARIKSQLASVRTAFEEPVLLRVTSIELTEHFRWNREFSSGNDVPVPTLFKRVGDQIRGRLAMSVAKENPNPVLRDFSRDLKHPAKTVPTEKNKLLAKMSLDKVYKVYHLTWANLLISK